VTNIFYFLLILGHCCQKRSAVNHSGNNKKEKELRGKRGMFRHPVAFVGAM